MIEKHRKEVDGSRAPNGSQWIEWKGGECPVAGDQEVVIRVREEPSAKLRLAKDCRWEHATERDGFYSARDIIAYRLVEPLLETGAPSRDWVEFRQQADRGEHPLPPAAPAATPRTESGEWPTPEYAQRIMFEGCDSVVMAPEDYEALYELARTLERENADLRGKLEQAQKDAERYRWVLPILNGDGHEGDERAFAIAAQLLKGLNGDAAIDAAKEASNG